MKRIISTILVLSIMFAAVFVFASCQRGPNGVIVDLNTNHPSSSTQQPSTKVSIKEVAKKEISRANITLIEYEVTDAVGKTYSFSVQLSKINYSVETHESNTGFFKMNSNDGIGLSIEAYVINENNDAIFYGGMPDPGSVTVVDENGSGRTYEDNLLHPKLNSGKMASTMEGYDCISHPGEFQGYITVLVYDKDAIYITSTNIPITIYAK